VVNQLPLFPLGSVLFPGLVMPLHIFERRYRVLVQALMALPDDATREFGIVAIRSGYEVGSDVAPDLHPVGCTATLREVTPYADGRFDIVAVGRTRFALQGIDGSAGTPYLTADVTLLPERDGIEETTAGAADPAGSNAGGSGSCSPALMRERARVVRLFLRYRELVGGRTIAMPAEGIEDAAETEPEEGESAMPDDPGVVSYLVAAATTLDLHTRQSLLEQPTTADRLRAETHILRREIELISTLRSFPDTSHGAAMINPN
jgi:ATP-dependent Lon protease